MREIRTQDSMVVEVFDTVTRDGAQSLPDQNQFPKGSKVGIAEQIASLGVNTIEAGFPATAGDSEEVAEVAQSVGQTEFSVQPRSIVNGELVDLPARLWTPVITGLSTAKPNHIEATWAAVKEAKHPGIHTFVATAEEHMRAKHSGMTQEEILDMAITGIRHSREIGGPETRIEFSCEAASTSDIGTLERFVKTALQEDIDVLNLPDTLGAASPNRMAHIFGQATQWIVEAGRQHDVMISSHNHNDGERAVQNAIASMHAVIDTAKSMGSVIPNFQFEGVAAPGLGERNGNSFLAPFVRDVLTDRAEFGAEVDLTIDTTKLKAVAEFICDQAKVPIDPNTVVIGRATTEHRSGVHSDAILKGGPAIYSAVNPQWFGHEFAGVLEDGKFQGTAGKTHLGGIEEYHSELVSTSAEVAERISAIGMTVDAAQLERITVNVNKNARANRRQTADTETERFVAQETGEDLRSNVAVLIYAGEAGEITRVTCFWRETKETTHGTEIREDGGPIAKRIAAANDALGFDGDYEDWKAHALEEGKDAIGSISLKVKQNGHHITAVAESDDVVDASLKAYVEAYNLIDRIEKRRAAAA